MASGKVRSPETFDFPVTDGSVPVNASYMPVECPFGSDMDVKTVPSGDFKYTRMSAEVVAAGPKA